MENQNTTTALAPGAEDALTLALAAAEKSGSLDKLKPQFSLVQEYLKINEGESFRGIFAGFTVAEFTDEDSGESRANEAVRLVAISKDGSKKGYIHAGASLVSTFKRSNLAPGSAVEVQFKEVKVEGKKRINIFDVLLLS
jgi:hypothetical protein